MVIVVGYVPKPEGRAALDWAVAEAQLRGARLLVLNSSRGDSYLDESLAPEEELHDIDERLAASGVEHEVRQPVRGQSPTEELLDVVEETGAELLVIGIRHRSAVGKLLLGSDAQRILLNAPCTVVAVKAGH